MLATAQGDIFASLTLPANGVEIITAAFGLAAEAGCPNRAAGDERHPPAPRPPYQKGDPRYVPTIHDRSTLLKARHLADIRKLYSEYLNGTHGELVVLGDFSTAKVVPLLDAMLGDWKARMPFAHVSRDIKLSRVPGGKEIETPDKANAVYIAALSSRCATTMRTSPRGRGQLHPGGSTLSSRLGDRVRQKEGLSYGVVSALGRLRPGTSERRSWCGRSVIRFSSKR